MNTNKNIKRILYNIDQSISEGKSPQVIYFQPSNNRWYSICPYYRFRQELCEGDYIHEIESRVVEYYPTCKSCNSEPADSGNDTECDACYGESIRESIEGDYHRAIGY